MKDVIQYRIKRGAKDTNYTVERRRTTTRMTKPGRLKRLFGIRPQEKKESFTGPCIVSEGEQFDEWYSSRTPEDIMSRYPRGYTPNFRRKVRTFPSIAKAQKWIDSQIKEDRRDDSYTGDWQP